MMVSREKILHLLVNDARLSVKAIAQRLAADETEVASVLASLEEDQTILGYNTVIDWSKTEQDPVTAMIEVRITPQKNEGYDQIAKRIYNFPQVSSCYLMSGGFDLMVIVEGKNLKTVASFVSEHIATQAYVLSTQTHFILKKYKVNGTSFMPVSKDEREAVIL